MNPICPYCQKESVLKDTSVIYGKSYGMAYICVDYPTCDSYVGVHKKTNKPLGRMANAELRNWKKAVHAVLDPIWQSGYAKRSDVYKALSELLQIPEHETHVGMFDEKRCEKALSVIPKLSEIVHEREVV